MDMLASKLILGIDFFKIFNLTIDFANFTYQLEKSSAPKSCLSDITSLTSQ